VLVVSVSWLAAMLERFYRELLNFLHRQVNDRHTAADLAQESYARVLAAQHAGQSVLDPRALLYRTAKNLITDQHRRSEVRRHDVLDTVAESEDLHAPLHQRPDEALASQQTVRAYADVIENLPPRCREAFVLHIIDGLPQAEIAQRMGISVSMVEKHVIRATMACRRCARTLDGSAAGTTATDGR
jgi:RNA polymerase sigma factor (sigma-70 family)